MIFFCADCEKTMLTPEGYARLRRLVLYVEDNLTNLALVEELLDRRPDLTLISACTGREGIALAGARQPVIILMDIHLPDMSGLDALKLLRAHSATSHIPVMALSSNAFARQIEQALDAGFCRYLTKPFKIAEFNDALDACLELAGAPHA
jgi:CheY-like chemotaxis protein